MLSFAQARQLAETWVAIMTEGRCVLVQRVEAKPYGWIFGYKSKDLAEKIAGNAPFIIDRQNGEIKALGTSPMMYKQRLAEYEQQLPKAAWFSLPEEPS